MFAEIRRNRGSGDKRRIAAAAFLHAPPAARRVKIVLTAAGRKNGGGYTEKFAFCDLSFIKRRRRIGKVPADGGDCGARSE